MQEPAQVRSDPVSCANSARTLSGRYPFLPLFSLPPPLPSFCPSFCPSSLPFFLPEHFLGFGLHDPDLSVAVNSFHTLSSFQVNLEVRVPSLLSRHHFNVQMESGLPGILPRADLGPSVVSSVCKEPSVTAHRRVFKQAAVLNCLLPGMRSAESVKIRCLEKRLGITRT